ncbi:MAG: hypothetical protein H6734_07785 [Alphaproteobacteria bacterium]|nr:hypothetical protein [Alphaproteobacteria bacterium]
MATHALDRAEFRRLRTRDRIAWGVLASGWLHLVIAVAVGQLRLPALPDLPDSEPIRVALVQIPPPAPPPDPEPVPEVSPTPRITAPVAAAPVAPAVVQERIAAPPPSPHRGRPLTRAERRRMAAPVDPVASLQRSMGWSVESRAGARGGSLPVAPGAPPPGRPAGRDGSGPAA